MRTSLWILAAVSLLVLSCSGGAGDPDDTVYQTDLSDLSEREDVLARDSDQWADGMEADQDSEALDDATTPPEDAEVVGPDLPKFRVEGNSILDGNGQVLFLRGVNLSGDAKGAPGHLIDVDDALVAELLANGVNSVRFLVFWDGVQPVSGDSVDQDYLVAVKQRMARLAEAGIFVVVDFHQDLWGWPFLVHGAPAWACPESISGGYVPQSPWWANYLTDQVTGCFDHFWGSPELRETYASMVASVAQMVCDNPMVVGFDFMNEPWPGSALPDPAFDNEVLLPFYVQVMARVDEVCPDRLVFAEPSGAFTFGLAEAMQIPGELRERIVVAPHYYPESVHESGGAGYGADDAARLSLRDDLESDWGAYLEQQVPLWVGEYGGLTEVPNFDAYMKDLHAWFLEHRVSSGLWDHSKSDSGFAFLDAQGNLKDVFRPVFQTPVVTRLPGPPARMTANYDTGTATAEATCRSGMSFSWLCPGDPCVCQSLMPTVAAQTPSLPGFRSFQCLKEGPVEISCGTPVSLVDQGTSDHAIFLTPDASPSEQRAAAELQEHLEACTGVTLPIVSEAPTPETPLIVLGRSEIAASLGVDPSDEALGEQGYVIRTVPPHLVIAGTAEAGTLYGVYRFLEEELGVRWFAPGEELNPQVLDVVVPPLDRTVKPAFLFRNTSYEWPGGDAEFRAHQLDNSGGGTEDNEFGIQHAHDGRAHSYFWYVSPDEYFETHPEYFSEIGGVRVRDETQLCLTNPEVLEIVTQRMLERMASKPTVRQHNFSQKDYYNYCQCEKCRAMNELYGTSGGTQFWFVNELAKRTAQVYPDKLIGTLAYTYTEEPPVGLEMHPNVAVWLCHMYPSCDSHPIESCPHNADYKRRAEAWAGLTEHLYIWHYIVDFTHYYNPFPNFNAMVADMRFYQRIGAEGIYLQGMGNSGGGGEFSLLRPYYGMQLLFDPRQDPEAIRQEFLMGYYGAAWIPIRDYIEMLLAEVTDKGIHMHLYTNPGQGYLSDEIMAQADLYFDQAQAAAEGDPEMVERVKVARMPLTYAKLFPRNGYEVMGDQLKWLGEMVDGLALVEFMDRMKAHGFTAVREVGGDPSLLMLLYSILSGDLDVEVLDNGILRAEVVPNLGGRTLRIIDVASGESITASNRIPSLFFPFAGGAEDRIGGAFEAYGWVEPTKVEEQDETHITLSQTTMNGYSVLRTVTLEPGSSTLLFETQITNSSGSSKEDRFRFHVEFDLGTLWDTVVEFNSLAGEEITQDMAPVISGMREGVHFYDQEAPDGAWTFSGNKGLRVVQRFDNQDFEYGWLYSYPEALEELEAEIWTPKIPMAPGDSRTFRHSLEVSAP